MRSQPHNLTLLVELEKIMPLGCKSNRLSSWMQFNIRFAISLNFGHLQKEANKREGLGCCKAFAGDSNLHFSLLICSPHVSIRDWKQLKLFVYRQHNCQPYDQLSGDRLAQEI